MNNELILDMISYGFAVVPGESGFLLKKKDQDVLVDVGVFADYEAAANHAENLIRPMRPKIEPKVYNFTVTVRYTRGLGVEYKTFQPILAENLDEAKGKARQEFEKFLPKAEVYEVRVRPC